MVTKNDDVPENHTVQAKLEIVMNLHQAAPSKGEYRRRPSLLSSCIPVPLTIIINQALTQGIGNGQPIKGNNQPL